MKRIMILNLSLMKMNNLLLKNVDKMNYINKIFELLKRIQIKLYFRKNQQMKMKMIWKIIIGILYKIFKLDFKYN